MKRITKGAAPPRLRSFYKTHPGAGYDDLERQRGLKEEIRDWLAREQGWICCYCNRRVEGDSSQVEHFVPQSIAPARAVDYDNMLASCLESTHCGIAKGARFDAGLTISPLDTDCESCFVYTADGQVLPTEGPRNDAAGYTVALLKLNCAALQERRKRAIVGAMDDVSALTDGEVRKLRSAYRTRRADGSYLPYCSAVSAALERYSRNRAR